MQLLAIVTLHDACPAFSSRTFEITEQLEKLEVRYNIGLVPFFNGEQDLPRFPKFVKQIECCSAEIALHGLYHENKRHQIDDLGQGRKHMQSKRYEQDSKYSNRLDSIRLYLFLRAGN